MYMEVEGARSRGRPRMTSLEVVKNDMKGLCLANVRVTAGALDRHIWGSMTVADICQPRFA